MTGRIRRDVIVNPEGGGPMRVGKGRLVTFPTGMSCTRDARIPVHTHYRVG